MPPSPAKSVAPPTLQESALRQLRADIIAFRLMPNERLRVEALRERYGMGISPLREALMRLEAEGLVELEQNKGFRVAEVSLEKGGVEWEANLLSAFHRLSRQTKIDPDNPDALNAAWRREHAEFHAALVAACASQTMMSIRSRLFEQAERYVALSIMANAPPRDDVAEHKQLMRAALNREIDRTLDLNRLHITRTFDKVAASLAAGRDAAARGKAQNGKALK